MGTGAGSLLQAVVLVWATQSPFSLAAPVLLGKKGIQTIDLDANARAPVMNMEKSKFHAVNLDQTSHERGVLVSQVS